jgi:hypothetical protein
MAMSAPPPVKLEEKEDKKGKGKRTHDDLEPEEIPAPSIDVLDYDGDAIK